MVSSDPWQRGHRTSSQGTLAGNFFGLVLNCLPVFGADKTPSGPKEARSRSALPKVFPYTLPPPPLQH